MAKLYFRYSSMGAGKSLELLKVSNNYKEKGKNTILYTSQKDNRYKIGEITSRLGIKEKAKIFSDKTNIFEEINIIFCSEEYQTHPHCILIDEAQFLTKQQVLQLAEIVDTYNIPVICYGLRIDYKGEPFEGSCYLLTLAETIEEIKTICSCGKKAIMNMRLIDNKPIFEGEQVIIGGNESYVSVCRKCYNKNKRNNQ